MDQFEIRLLWTGCFKPLALITNTSIDTGIYPSKLKSSPSLRVRMNWIRITTDQSPFCQYLIASWKNLCTSNNQKLEKYVRCVLLLYNWDLRVFFGQPPTTDTDITSYF